VEPKTLPVLAIDETSNGRTLEAALGQTVEICLTENPTTGAFAGGSRRRTSQWARSCTMLLSQGGGHRVSRESIAGSSKSWPKAAARFDSFIVVPGRVTLPPRVFSPSP